MEGKARPRRVAGEEGFAESETSDHSSRPYGLGAIRISPCPLPFPMTAQ